MKQNLSEEFRRELGALREKLDELKKGTGNLIFALIPSVLYDIGFVEAVEDSVTDFSRQYRVAIRVKNNLQNPPPNQEIATFLLKAIREFMRNAINHGGADKIHITLDNGNNTIKIIVADNGAGFRASANELLLKEGSGFGLFNIKTRAEYYKGGIEMAASPELGGARIAVWMPLTFSDEKQT